MWIEVMVEEVMVGWFASRRGRLFDQYQQR